MRDIVGGYFQKYRATFVGENPEEVCCWIFSLKKGMYFLQDLLRKQFVDICFEQFAVEITQTIWAPLI